MLKGCQKLQKHLMKILLFLIFLPIVSASHFTGSFNDYGNDTGFDGLYNYLVIEAQVQITNPNKDYTVLGILEDNNGNLIEYNDCRGLPSGTSNVKLDFEGIKIYKNKVNGPYKLKYIELSSIDDCNGGGMPPNREHSLFNAYTTKSYQYTEFQKGEPAVYCQNSPCIASSDLIKSRDNLTTKEPNAPNTIDGCEDGFYGNYLDTESIESITVTSLNHTFFKIGDTIKVDITVYCDEGSSDKLNFVYSNNIDDIQWKVKDNKQCSSNGIQTFSTTFVLDNNIGQHAVRGVFSFTLNPNTVCGKDETDDTPYWADNDDVVIYVKGCNTDNDCTATECDNLDKCYSGTYRDYHDVENTCDNSACTQNECSVYTEIITDIDGDGYDEECDNDCRDDNPNINPGINEICDNGIDDNCDDYVDMDDPECLGKYQINLAEGWNLISLPKIEDNDINEVIKIFNGFEKIVTLKNGKWHIYDKLNLANSNLEEVSESNGFWIKVSDNSSFLVDDESAASIYLDLKKGWNTIGYPSLEEKDLEELFQNVMDDIELVYVYNNEFFSFNPKKPSDIIIKPGTGILVKIKDDASWHFDGVYNKGQEQFNLDLFEGWNLISIPLASDKTVNEIFGPTTLNYLGNQEWKQLDENDKINYEYGYWIKTDESSLLIEGNRINNLDFDINQGWNLINYPLTAEENVNTFFQNVMNNIESIRTFEDGEWKSFNPVKPIELNSLNVLKPGKGIFIKARDNEEWYFNGDELVVT